MPLAPDILAGLARRLVEHAGLELPAWVVEARARARIAALAIEPDAYLALIESTRGERELGELIELLRVGETRLFRHAPQIDALVALVPPLVRARGRKAVKVWSAGCATGEEAYTLAVVLVRALPGFDVSILATDVSADALEVAHAGRYPPTAIDRVPAPWREDFVVTSGELRVKPEIAARVTFAQENLLDDSTRRRGFDVVWCRNVLIYFGAAARRRVVDRLIGALEPGGLLFVGYSETLRDVAELEPVRAGEAVAYARRATATPRRTPVTGVPIAVPPSPTPPPTIVARDRRVVIAADCDVAMVTREIAAVLGARQRLTVEVAGDAPDEVAPVLRRARAAGLAITFVATGGAKQWLRRHRLEEEP